MLQIGSKKGFCRRKFRASDVSINNFWEGSRCLLCKSDVDISLLFDLIQNGTDCE